MACRAREPDLTLPMIGRLWRGTTRGTRATVLLLIAFATWLAVAYSNKTEVGTRLESSAGASVRAASPASTPPRRSASGVEAERKARAASRTPVRRVESRKAPATDPAVRRPAARKAPERDRAAAVVVPEEAAERPEDTTEAPRPAARPCADTPPPAVGADVICRTAKARLHIVTGRTPVHVAESTLTVVDQTLVGDVVRLKIRVRNRSQRPIVLNERGNQIYINARGRRSGSREPIRVGGNMTRTVELRFALPGEAPGRGNPGARIDVGVVPFSQLDAEQPRRLGIIRLKVKPPSF